MLIHVDGVPSDSCGKWTWRGKGFTLDSCMSEARDMNHSAFSFGKGRYMASGCYTEAIEVTMENWREWLQDRTAPPCPNGDWVTNPYFDTYVIEPAMQL